MSSREVCLNGLGGAYDVHRKLQQHGEEFVIFLGPFVMQPLPLYCGSFDKIDTSQTTGLEYSF